MTVSPLTRTWWRCRVVSPYVWLSRAYRSDPTRKNPRSSSLTAALSTWSRSSSRRYAPSPRLTCSRNDGSDAAKPGTWANLSRDRLSIHHAA